MQTKADRLRAEALRLLSEKHGGSLPPGDYTLTGRAAELMQEATLLDAQKATRKSRKN